MANKFAKEFSEENNRDFGSFTPKDNTNSKVDEVSGAKGNSGNVNGKQQNNAPSTQKGLDQSRNASMQKAQNSVSAGKQGGSSINPIEEAKTGVKSDLKASVTGQHPDDIKQEERDKNSGVKNTTAKVARHKAAKGLSSKLGGNSAKTIAGKAGSSFGGKLTGGFGALKNMAGGAIGAVKSAAGAVGATAVKAGAAVGSALNVSATVGTALVLSGTIAAATIPTAGIIGYGMGHHTQRTDGCTPEEYDDPTASGGELIAVTAERLAWPEGTPTSKYDYDEGGTPTDAAAAAADKWYPELKNGSWAGRSGRYWKMACCCHSANVIVREACQTNTIGNLLPNVGSADAAKQSLENALEGQGFSIFPYDGHESSLQRGDVLSYSKKSGGGHVWIYLGEGKSADGGRNSNSFSHVKGSQNRDANLNDYNYYFVMRKQGGSSVSVTSNQSRTATNTVTGRKNIQAVIDWATMIANDDSYHYGKGHDGYFTCDYCHHPNASSKAYTCMPFVAAAYAHGTNDPALMYGGRHCMYLDDKNFEGRFAGVWGKVGNCKDLSFSQLQPGDVIIKYDPSGNDSNGHAWLYGGGDTVLESTGGYGPRKVDGAEKKFNGYSHQGAAPSKNYVMRYIGDGSPLFGSAAYNDLVADMTADDGCGGEMNGAEELDAYIGKGMKKVTAANGEEYIILDFDLEQVKKLERQGDQQCFIYSIGYCDLILGGKFRCSIDGSFETRNKNMRAAYGSGNGEDGDPSKINGTPKHPGSGQGMVDLAVKEIKQGRPVIFWVGGTASGTHFVCVCGWKANAGSNITWNDLVCCDPAYLPDWAPANSDGLRTLEKYTPHSGYYVCTFEDWKPGEGQKPRQ